MSEGYSENMDVFSYFPSGIEGSDKKLLDEDEDFEEWHNCMDGKPTRDVYVVTSDDPNFEGFRSTGDMHDDSSDESERWRHRGEWLWEISRGSSI